MEDLPKVLGAILETVVQGEITLGVGQTLTTLLEAYPKGLETTYFDARLTALEKERFHGKP